MVVDFNEVRINEWCYIFLEFGRKGCGVGGLSLDYISNINLLEIGNFIDIFSCLF